MPRFRFSTAFICKEVLQEPNGVFSAIRLIEIIHVPEGADDFPLHFHAVILLKTAPALDTQVRIGMTLVKPSGERVNVVDSASAPPHQLRIFENDPSVPSGVNLVVEFNFKPEMLGTWLVEIDVDGEVEATTSFTIRREIESSGS